LKKKQVFRKFHAFYLLEVTSLSATNYFFFFFFDRIVLRLLFYHLFTPIKGHL